MAYQRHACASAPGKAPAHGMCSDDTAGNIWLLNCQDLSSDEGGAASWGQSSPTACGVGLRGWETPAIGIA